MTGAATRTAHRADPARTPQADDVIVRRHAPQSVTPFTLGIYKRGEQLAARTYEAAAAHANSFARHSGVNVWYVEGDSWQCIAEYRSTAQRSTRIRDHG